MPGSDQQLPARLPKSDKCRSGPSRLACKTAKVLKPLIKQTNKQKTSFILYALNFKNQSPLIFELWEKMPRSGQPGPAGLPESDKCRSGPSRPASKC